MILLQLAAPCPAPARFPWVLVLRWPTSTARSPTCALPCTAMARRTRCVEIGGPRWEQGRWEARKRAGAQEWGEVDRGGGLVEAGRGCELVGQRCSQQKHLHLQACLLALGPGAEGTSIGCAANSPCACLHMCCCYMTACPSAHPLHDRVKSTRPLTWRRYGTSPSSLCARTTTTVSCDVWSCWQSM